jgi:hypothetical protein
MDLDLLGGTVVTESTAAPSSIPYADPSDMLAVHAVFRQALDGAPDLIGTVAPSDSARAAVVGSYFANVLDLLDVHHAGEDELLWNKLVDRLPERADEIREIAAQHDDLDAVLPGARAAVDVWTATPDVAQTLALVNALTDLRDPLYWHLAQEENRILPLVSEVITAAEWGELPVHGMTHFTGDKLWLILGLIRENMTEADRAAMLAAMPPPAVEFWTGTGEGLFTAFMAELRS